MCVSMVGRCWEQKYKGKGSHSMEEEDQERAQ